MTRNVTAELLVLRKRAATWILLGIWTLLGVFFAYVVPYALDPEDAPGGLGQFFPESLTGTLLEGFPFFGGVFALMLGVFALGSEYGWSTPRTLFTQGPGRLRVFASKLVALGMILVPFVLTLFAAGAVASYVIAQIEDAPVNWPSAWLLVRAMAAGWLILAVWAALGTLLGVLTRGTSLAIGVGILYALVIEGLLSAFTDSVSLLEPLTDVFLRANGYSLAVALGASADSIEASGPGSFGGPFVDSAQALVVLVAFTAGFLALRDSCFDAGTSRDRELGRGLDLARRRHAGAGARLGYRKRCRLRCPARGPVELPAAGEAGHEDAAERVSGSRGVVNRDRGSLDPFDAVAGSHEHAVRSGGDQGRRGARAGQGRGGCRGIVVTGQERGLAFVRSEDGTPGEQRRRKPSRRRRVHHHRHAACGGALGTLHDDLVLELEAQQGTPGPSEIELLEGPLHVVCPEHVVGAGGDGDLILALLVDHDRGDPRRGSLDAGHSRYTHALPGEVLDQPAAELVGSDGSDQGDGGSRARRRDGLVGALAATGHLEAAARDCLAGARQGTDAHEQVGVERADHEQLWRIAHRAAPSRSTDETTRSQNPAVSSSTATRALGGRPRTPKRSQTVAPRVWVPWSSTAT